MTPTIKIDTTEFNRTLKEYLVVNRRDLADILNVKMFMILAGARRKTPAAYRSKILADLGAEDVNRASKKTGKTKTGFKLTKGRNNPFAILRYWAKKKGWTIDPKDERKAARKLIGRRLASVGTLARGWNAALTKFARAAREVFDIGAGRKPKTPAGYQTKIAEPGWNPVATAEYSLAIKQGEGAFHIDPRVENAAGDSFADETRSMKEYIAKHMQARINATK